MSEKLIHRLLALLLFVSSLTVYIMTMAASVSFWDAGEFIATSYILGIPHSPGTPLYVLVGRVFCILPLALSVAQKVNLLSALSASLGVLMIYLSGVYSVRFIFGRGKTLAGKIARYTGPVAGSSFLMFSDTYWTNAAEAEVYALSAFVMGLCTVLALKWLRDHDPKIDPAGSGRIVSDDAAGSGGKRIEDGSGTWNRPSGNLILLIIYLLSLGIGFHLGTIVIYSGIFIMLLMVRNKEFDNVELFVFTFGFGVIAADMTVHRNSMLTAVLLSVFVLMMIWVTITRGRFVLLATGLLVLGISVHLYLLVRSGINPAIDEVDPENWKSLYAVLRREQYPPMDIFTRKAPMAFQIEHFMNYFSRQFRLIGDYFAGPVNVGTLTSSIPLCLGVLGIVANYMREKKSWALNFTNLVMNSAGLILFLNFTDHEVRERDYFFGAAFYFFALFIGIGATALLTLLAEQAEKAGRNLMRAVVPASVALVVISVLPSFHHWHSHDRSKNFIARDYAYNMLAGLEADAIIFTNGDNDTFPLWYLQNVEHFRADVRVANLSLLNTSWYIRQLRDRYPSVPLELNDAEIDMLRPIRVKDGILWKRDLAVNHIIRSVNLSRPIYFAVTVPSEVWHRYSENLEMQGMVRRYVTRRGKYLVNDFQIERNLSEIFEYRGVLNDDFEKDDSVYKPENVENMFINFSIAAFQLAQLRSKGGEDDDAARWAEISYNFAPDFDWPKKYLGIYYVRNGQYDKAVAHYRREIDKDPGSGELWINLAGVYEAAGDLERSLKELNNGIDNAGEFRDLFGQAFRVAAVLGRADEARGYIEAWLDIDPDDQEYRSFYDDIDSVLQIEFGIGGDSGAETAEGTY